MKPSPSPGSRKTSSPVAESSIRLIPCCTAPSALWVAVLLFAATALGLRLSHPSLWYDEAISWQAVSGSWAEALSYTVGGEACGGFSYILLLKLWTTFCGTSELAMRSMSVVFSLLLVIVMGLLGRALGGQRIGMASALLCLFHPQVLFWGRETRAYALALFATALCLYGLTIYVRTGKKLLLTIGAFLVVSSHIFGALVAGAATWFLAVRGFEGDSFKRRVVSAARNCDPMLLSGCAVVGWAFLLRKRIRTNLDDFWITGSWWSNFTSVLAELFPVLPITLLAWTGGWFYVWRAQKPSTNSAASRRNWVGFAGMAAVLFGGPTLASLLANGYHNYIHIRYHIFAIPLIIIPLAFLVERLSIRSSISATVFLGIGWFAWSDSDQLYHQSGPWGDDARQGAEFLLERWEQGDQIVVFPDIERDTLLYYGINDQLNVHSFPRPQVNPKLRNLLADAPKRVWVFAFQGEKHRPEHLDISGQHAARFGNLRLYCL